MARPYPSVPGMDVLVPLIALGIGLFTGFVVYRHATRNQIQSPLLWGGFVGGAFFLGSIILKPYLIPVYYSLFVKPGPGLLIRPLHALTTILGGGAIVGTGATLLYFAHVMLVRRRGSISV